jgi:CubicO group peptidase (beta-lactamase class C family)
MPEPIHLTTLEEILPGSGLEEILASTLHQRWLNGLAVGILRKGQRYVRCYGPGVNLDSQFQLGSLTKTYTSELLACMVADGTVSLDDPAAKYLTPGKTLTRAGQIPITLRDLATHTSGLPRISLRVRIYGRDPYAHFTTRMLDAWLRRHPLTRPAQTSHRYSNLGYALLGEALARAAGKPYPELLRQYLLAPAGLHHTQLTLSGQPHAPLLRGHTQAGAPTPAWRFDAYAACGALQSSVADQLQWIAWIGQDSQRLAMTRQHAYTQRHQGKTIPLANGLGWHLLSGDTLAWHSGVTGGFCAYYSLNKATGDAVILLSNRAAPLLVVTLARKLEAALAGKPVTPLRGNYGLTLARILAPIHWLRPLLGPLAIFPLWLRLVILVGMGFLLDHLPYLGLHLFHAPLSPGNWPFFH